MLTWLVESTTLLTILLGTVAIILMAVWWRTRKPGWAAGAGVAMLLIIGLVVLDRFVETDTKRIENAVHEMVSGLKAHDMDRLFAHVAETFDYHGNKKAEFRQKATETIRRHDVVDADIKDLAVHDVDREKRTARVEFLVRPRGNFNEQELHFRVRAEYVLDPDEQWRLKGFEVFHIVGAQPLSVPGF